MDMQANPEHIKKLLITIALSLAIILPLNLLPALLYLVGFFHYPGPEDLGQSALTGSVLLFFLIDILPYLSIGYFGHMKRKMGLAGCLAATLACFLITFLVSFGISGYLYSSGIYVNPPDSVPIGFWHFSPGSNALQNSLMETSIILRLIFSFIGSLIAGLSIPIFSIALEGKGKTVKR